MRYVIGGLLAALLSACGGDYPAMDVVADVDPESYAGKWYEIASIPNSFQDQCVSDTTADYTVRDDGRFGVLNRCRMADGTFDEADGVARFTGEGTEGKLEVSFVSLLGIRLWFAGGDYWVLALDDDYQWSLVGNPSRDYAWILARATSLPLETLGYLAAVLKDQGYDTCRLRITSSDQGEGQPALCEVLKN